MTNPVFDEDPQELLARLRAEAERRRKHRNWDTTAAHARSTDPSTSHEAAASVEDLRESQTRVLAFIARHGPITDEDLARVVRGEQFAISPSGLRTRRSELVHLGLVRDSGKRTLTNAGRRTILWEVVP